MGTKTPVSLDQMFSAKALDDMRATCARHREVGTFPHSELVAYIRPHMERIDEVTGQPNDVNYMAYLIEHVMHAAHTKPNVEVPDE